MMTMINLSHVFMCFFSKRHSPVFNKKDNKLKNFLCLNWYQFLLVVVLTKFKGTDILDSSFLRKDLTWLNESSIPQFTLLTIHKTCSLAKNKFCFNCVHGKQSTWRHFTFLLAISWHLAFEECRSTEQQRNTTLPFQFSEDEVWCNSGRFPGVLIVGWGGFRVRQPLEQPTDA